MANGNLTFAEIVAMPSKSIRVVDTSTMSNLTSSVIGITSDIGELEAETNGARNIAKFIEQRARGFN